MTPTEAVAKRIRQLCQQRGIAVNTLANLAEVTPSTVYSILNLRSQNPGVVTIHRLCEGLEISVRDFFDSPFFDDMGE
jgi:transcriptional regulator with XRE-family HTH domain